MQLICEPIGIIHTDKKVKFETPHQPINDVSEQNVIELFSGHGFENGLRDLAGFDRIWLIWWFEKNKTWRPLVTPPRGSGKRRGVFATRSPHRPCPIGMTAVPLISISENKIIVGNVDLLDKTPILDIKPYIMEIDSFQDQKQGWLDEEKLELVKPPVFKIKITEFAATQLSWLKNKWNIDFIDKTTNILERSPSRSRTNRITSSKDGISRLSCGAWRVFFTVDKEIVSILKVAPGYPVELLMKEGFEIIPDYKAQIEFRKIWG